MGSVSHQVHTRQIDLIQLTHAYKDFPKENEEKMLPAL